MEIAFLISAFFAGVFMFLAPCTLPLVPGFLSFVGGDGRNKTIKNTLFFILGFSFVFISFGALVSFLGESLVVFRNTLSFLGGVFIIFFGRTHARKKYHPVRFRSTPRCGTARTYAVHSSRFPEESTSAVLSVPRLEASAGRIFRSESHFSASSGHRSVGLPRFSMP